MPQRLLQVGLGPWVRTYQRCDRPNLPVFASPLRSHRETGLEFVRLHGRCEQLHGPQRIVPAPRLRSAPRSGRIWDAFNEGDPGQHNCNSPGDCSATIDNGSEVPCAVAFGSALMTASGSFWLRADTILGDSKIHYQWHPPVGAQDDHGTAGYWSVVADGVPCQAPFLCNPQNWQ